VLTEAYLARLQDSLEMSPSLLSRWQAVNAVARLAEGMPREPLLEVWRRFGWVDGFREEPQAAAG
jgi:hypothetical protein